MSRPVPLPEPFLHRAFLASEALAAGVSGRRLRGQDLHTPFWGVRTVDVPKGRRELVLAASARLRPGQAFAGSSAAALWGLPLPPNLARRDTPVVVAAQKGSSVPRGRGFIGVRLTESRFRTAWIDNVPVTDPVTTWALLAREVERRSLVAAGDILITESKRTRRRCPPLSLDEMADTVDRWRGSPGAVAMRSAVEALRPGVDSPMESELRQVIVDAGFPEPTVHPTVVLRSGSERAPDLGYEALKLGIEYEGEGHATPEQMRSDITRVEDFAEVGWTIVRVTVRDLNPTPVRFLQRLSAAIDRCIRVLPHAA